MAESEGTVHGTLEASGLAPGCPGFVQDAPQVTLEARYLIPRAFLSVSGPRPLAAVVRSPSGRTRCVTSPDGMPTLEAAFEEGEHEVFVASLERLPDVFWKLRVTAEREGSSAAPGALAADAEGGASVREGEAATPGRPGSVLHFHPGEPGPVVSGVSSYAGGDETALVDCARQATGRPDHEWSVEAEGAARLHARATGPVVIALRSPGGSLRCSDVSATPSLRGAAAPGVHEVWVRSRHRGTSHAYHLAADDPALDAQELPALER